MNNFIADSRKGVIAVFTVLAAGLFIGLLATVTDVGYVYYSHAKLQTAINAGWKAGFDRLLSCKRDGSVSPEELAAIEAHIREVVKANGYPNEAVTPESLIIEINPETNHLVVRSNQDVGTFFARYFQIEKMEISSSRDQQESLRFIPLAIPHGVVKDVSNNAYRVYMFGTDEGFASGTEYILKLGKGKGSASRLLVPMAAGDQPTNSAYRLAYGAAYWCLQIDEGDSGFGPVFWLLGYRGGAFMLQDYPEVRAKLGEYGVRYEILPDINTINSLLESLGSNVMEINSRPRIAVYSSTSAPDPVENILRNSKIPYGPYSLPGSWGRYESFNPNSCSSFYDEGILSGELDKYHWLHLHHEDFTGFSGGCKNWKNAPENNSSDPDCQERFSRGTYGQTDTQAKRTAAKEYMCDYCYARYNAVSNAWGSGNVTVTLRSSNPSLTAQFSSSGLSVTVTSSSSSRYVKEILLTFVDGATQLFTYTSGTSRTVSGSAANSNKTISQVRVLLNNISTYYYGNSTVVVYDNASCRHYKRRCAEFATYRWWQEYENVKPAVPGAAFDQYLYRNIPLIAGTPSNTKYICYGDDTKPLCLGYKRLDDIAISYGYSNSNNSLPKPQKTINASNFLDLDEPGWFLSASRVQQMKFDVVKKVKDHVNAGGFLFAQCFAPETFELALFQRSIYLGNSIAAAYGETLAFKDFTYKSIPLGDIPLQFSSINTKEYAGGHTPQPFTLAYPYDPRTQNHGNPDTSTGHTASFLKSTVKLGVLQLGVRSGNANYIKYVGGEHGNGVFAYLGGHYHDNIYAERLVLNNILFGSTSTKEVTEGGGGLSGRRKHSYGPIDPDNTLVDGDKETNYIDRMLNGYNSPLDLNDRLNVEPNDNLASATQIVTDQLFADAATYSRRIVVPITDVGPEIAANNATNSTALTIYDIQDRDNASGSLRPADFNFGSSVRIIGFAEFELIDRDDDEHGYDREGMNIEDGAGGDLGTYQTGQIRGRFMRYIVDPREVAALLDSYTP